jgi:hypothetical protein
MALAVTFGAIHFVAAVAQIHFSAPIAEIYSTAAVVQIHFIAPVEQINLVGPAAEIHSVLAVQLLNVEPRPINFQCPIGLRLADPQSVKKSPTNRKNTVCLDQAVTTPLMVRPTV